MKYMVFAASLLLIIVISCSKNKGKEAINTPSYDSLLAKKLGSDKYGMKAYVMAFLKKGPNRPTDSTERANLQAAHMKNIGRLAEEGKLIVAGPFLDDQEIRGIYIFNVSSVEEARALTQTDPAIQVGSLVMELHPWYGSAALIETVEIHKKLQKTSITE